MILTKHILLPAFRPAGVFEWKAFENGTHGVLLACIEATKNGAVTIVGGGDTATAVAKWKAEDKVQSLCASRNF